MFRTKNALKTQQKRIRKPLEKRINNILDHGAYIMGPEVFELEEKLADYCGVKHAISCSSGTDALLIPLMAWGIGPGDAVFTTPFTYVATAEVISILGATPVFVDVYKSTYNIDCDKLEIEINKVINACIQVNVSSEISKNGSFFTSPFSIIYLKRSK